MASFVATARQTVATTFNSLEQDRVITYDRRLILVRVLTALN
ncbi:hypothetical protein [Marinifilum fragile]